MRRIADGWLDPLRSLLDPYGLTLQYVTSGAALPGSYWGAPEAGLVGNTLFVQPDTPLHSALNEAAHFVCMDATRRIALERDAGGDHDEENAVCLLQILWADVLAGVGRDQLMADMDAWGYTFRLGSAARWFAEEAGDARSWLVRRGILDQDQKLTGRCAQA